MGFQSDSMYLKRCAIHHLMSVTKRSSGRHYPQETNLYEKASRRRDQPWHGQPSVKKQDYWCVLWMMRKNKEDKPHVNGNGIHFKVISNDGARIEDTDLKQWEYQYCEKSIWITATLSGHTFRLTKRRGRKRKCNN